jgi:F420 biosynthesis protein FbiB-like protein
MRNVQKTVEAVEHSLSVEIVEKLLRGRRSIRRYKDRPVPISLVNRLIGAATYAPSAHNRQPWRFAVLQSRAKQERLAVAMAERLRADRISDGDDAETVFSDLARSISRISNAPVLVLICLTMEEMDRYPDARRTTAERHMAVQSTAMAMQNFLLTAHAVGLGASVMCAPLFCPDTLQKSLSLPIDWEPQSLVTLGYPATNGKPFQRRGASELTSVIDV